MGKLRGLGFKMAGNAKVKPVLDLSGQIKDFDSHGKVLSSSELAVRTAGEPVGRRTVASTLDIASRTDRFQYLLVNIS
jgi:hypothetical protein